LTALKVACNILRMVQPDIIAERGRYIFAYSPSYNDWTNRLRPKADTTSKIRSPRYLYVAMVTEALRANYQLLNGESYRKSLKEVLQQAGRWSRFEPYNPEFICRIVAQSWQDLHPSSKITQAIIGDGPHATMTDQGFLLSEMYWTDLLAEKRPVQPMFGLLNTRLPSLTYLAKPIKVG
jgi:hypothetical protein